MGQLSDHAGRSIDPTSRSTVRKVYVAPHLLEYGSVAKITQGSGLSNADGMGSGCKRPGAFERSGLACWHI